MNKIEFALPLDYRVSAKKRMLYSLNQFLLPLGAKNPFCTYVIKKMKAHMIGVIQKRLLPFVQHEATGFKYFPEERFPLAVEMRVFRNSNRQSDMDNKAIVCKWATDEIVKAGLIPSDHWAVIKSLKIVDGGLDKENPRLEYKLY
jgi:hypothetical protein